MPFAILAVAVTASLVTVMLSARRPTPVRVTAGRR